MPAPARLNCPDLKDKGLVYFDFNCPEHWADLIRGQNYDQLDQEVFDQTAQGGPLREKLLEYADFNHIEHILSLRSAPKDEEGIWHDDGSRPLAFSLGLNLEPAAICGGELLFREKQPQAEISRISPLPFGRGVVFLTGLWGKEHRVCAVTRGQRLVLAGWCTLEN